MNDNFDLTKLNFKTKEKSFVRDENSDVVDAFAGGLDTFSYSSASAHREAIKRETERVKAMHKRAKEVQNLFLGKFIDFAKDYQPEISEKCGECESLLKLIRNNAGWTATKLFHRIENPAFQSLDEIVSHLEYLERCGIIEDRGYSAPTYFPVRQKSRPAVDTGRLNDSVKVVARNRENIKNNPYLSPDYRNRLLQGTWKTDEKPNPFPSPDYPPGTAGLEQKKRQDRAAKFVLENISIDWFNSAQSFEILPCLKTTFAKFAAEEIKLSEYVELAIDPYELGSENIRERAIAYLIKHGYVSAFYPDKNLSVYVKALIGFFNANYDFYKSREKRAKENQIKVSFDPNKAGRELISEAAKEFVSKRTDHVSKDFPKSVESALVDFFIQHVDIFRPKTVSDSDATNSLLNTQKE